MLIYMNITLQHFANTGKQVEVTEEQVKNNKIIDKPTYSIVYD